MRILAIDTATERCSVAVRVDGNVLERCVETPRGHADLILPMIQETLAEACITLHDLDGLAYGRGPGAFTGVRIAIGVVQGLAFGTDLPTVGVSNLAAVAQQVATPLTRILVCMDARMNEVYWGEFSCSLHDGLVVAAGAERVSAAHHVQPQAQPDVVAGTGFRAFPDLAARFSVPVHDLLPRASAIALLAEPLLALGEGLPAEQAQPVYLRDNVAVAKKQ